MSKEKTTLVRTGRDESGVRFAITHFVNVFGQDCGYEVLKFATNHREGSRWVTCKKDMTLTDAKSYFDKRVSG